MHLIGGTMVEPLLPIYDKVVGAITGNETVIVGYTVPTGQKFFIQGVIASGKADGEFRLRINGDSKLYGRTSSAERESKNVFGGAVGIQCVEGDQIQVSVINWEPTPQDYEATITGFLKPA